MRVVSTILILLLTAHGLSAQTTIEERLSKLEQQVRELRAENEALRKRLPLPAAQEVKPAGSEPRLQVGGLLQVQGESGGLPDSRFGDDHDRVFLRRARVNASGKFSEAVDFRLELDASGSLGSATGLRAQLTDGYVTWTKFPAASIRAGQFKTPFGFEQLYSDPLLPAPERTLGSDRLSLGRQLGVQLAGTAFDQQFSYAVGAFNGTGVNVSSNDDEAFLVAGRVAGAFLRPHGSDKAMLRVGINGFRSDDRNVAFSSDFGFDSTPGTSALDNLFAGRRHGLGADAQVTLGPVEIWTEMLRASFEPESRLPRRDFDASSWFIQGAFPLVTARWQGVVRYDTFDPDDRLSADSTRSWLVGTNYFLKGHDLKLQLHYLRSERAGQRDGRVIARVQTVF